MQHEAVEIIIPDEDKPDFVKKLKWIFKDKSIHGTPISDDWDYLVIRSDQTPSLIGSQILMTSDKSSNPEGID